jgi:hypothetical protein
MYVSPLHQPVINFRVFSFRYVYLIISAVMALGSIKPQTEISIKNPCGRKGRPARKADNLIAISVPIV